MCTARRILVSALCAVVPAFAAAQDNGTLKVSSSYNHAGYCGMPLRASRLILQPALGGPPVEARTDLAGNAQIKAPVGDYVLVSEDTLLLKSECVTWRVPVHLEKGTTKLALTNANLTTLRRWTDSTSADSAVANAALTRWAPSLVSVSAGGRTGTGVVVDKGGLILTSDHLAETDNDVIVAPSAKLRVRASVVSRDATAGLAVLLVPASAVADVPPADLGTDPELVPGTFVTVLRKWLDGDPGGLWTPVTGIDGAALVVDLPYAHKANGGILVTSAGEIAAIVSAHPRALCATPVPNAVAVSRARPLLEAARRDVGRVTPPDPTPLPAWPDDWFTPAMLDSIADASPPDKYEGLDELKAGHFRVRLETPPHDVVTERADDAERRKNIEKWASKAKPEQRECWASLKRPPEKRPNRLARTAVIELYVDAAVQSSGGVKLYGIPVEKPGIHMEGDLGHAIIFRNGEPVAPIVGGTDMRTHRLYTPQGEWADSAHIGWFVLSPLVLAPDPNGAPPTIGLYLPDRRNPSEPSCLELPPAKVALLWNDFLPVYAGREPAPVRADPRVAPVTPRPAQGKACPALRDSRPF